MTNLDPIPGSVETTLMYDFAGSQSTSLGITKNFWCSIIS